ncbi:MAG TPA: CHAD domain-containing protein [Thermoanaerobaculia bacterium]|nr:CHAD domain-containing protein [Thermoanaerobaculia bacterium]
MPYAILKDETVPDAIHRIMDEQIVRAREHLLDAKAPPAERIHEARKRFKETRAVLRLVREPLGAAYAVENAWYRDAGRKLSATRDADAMLEALAKLDLPRAIRYRIRRRLQAHRAKTPPLDGLIAETVDQLTVAQARVALWPRLDDSFDTLAGGLLRIYREGRRSMRTASTPAEMHEWRKRVKMHWYHVQLLREMWPSMMKTYAGVTHDLSDVLGDHHDLHVLRGVFPNPPAELLAALGARQRQLEQEAHAIGTPVYAEKPQVWLARMRKYWTAWR